jgi:hypothetical protein
MKSLLIAAVLASASLARAQQASCTLRDVEGEKGKAAIDPGLDDVKALLQKPPFLDYATYRLVGAQTLALHKGAPQTGTLGNRHRFQLTLMDRLTEREGRARLRLRFEIKNADGKDELNTIVVVDENGAPLPRVEQHGERIFLQLIGCKSS